jgi:hypothetical protein
MNAQLLAVLQKLESADLAILVAGLLPALEAEVQDLSKGSAAISAVESVVFSATLPAAQAALASLVAKIPVV